MNRKVSIVIGGMIFLSIALISTHAYSGECTSNSFQPTFVRHNSVSPAVFYVTGNGFVQMASPAEAQQTCRAQGVRMRINGGDCFRRNWGDFGCGCNITPSPNTTCAAFQNFLSACENRLRTSPVWNETESGWTGVWTRRGGSNMFDASWTAPRGDRATAVLTMNVRGNRVTILRRDPRGGTCNYTGDLRSDMRTVVGTYSCSWAAGPIPWQASLR